MSDDLKLLVEWSNPWEEFRTAIGPALGRSATPLAGEAHTGLWPYRGMAATWVLEALLLLAVIVLPGKYEALHPTVHSPAKYDVLYFSGDELPQTKDFGGAQAGRSGRAGGKEAFHRSQTIRVARGDHATEKVVDAPDLKLPVSTAPVANLLAVNKAPGPPPSEGLRATHAPSTLSKDAIIAPPPQVIRSLTKTPALDSQAIAPPADSSGQRSHSISTLAANIVAPPPSDVSADRRTPMTGLPATVISPSPTDVTHDSRALVAMNTPIIPPSPRDVNRELPPLTGPAARNSNVVPPPVSAPERATNQNAKLRMPAPAVIAPPPSQVVRDQRTVTGVALGDPQKVVPPPASAPNQIAQRNPAAIMGSAQIVPPPPSVGGGSSLSGSGGGRPDQHGVTGGSLGAPQVIPPPPSVGGSRNGGGAGSQGMLSASLSGAPIPPPPDASAGSGGLAGGGRSIGSGLGSDVVAPAPKHEAGSLAGRGTGNKGSGSGGVLDAGSALAPPNGGGNGAGKGLVITNDPGSAVGRPGNVGAGATAMSPAGGNQPGLGGSGGGTGIGRGPDSGSGLNGTGPGAGKDGAGRGIDPSARGGISPQPGPGGAGTGTTGQPAIPGVSVQGGNTVNLPSFGSGGSDPNPAGHSGMGANDRHSFDVTVVGTASSGGAFNNYRQFKADKVYTRYIETAAGRVSMQYFDPSSAAHPYTEDLVAPDPIRFDMPAGIGRSRLVIACVLDTSGILKNLRVLEGGSPDMTPKVMAALPAWKFRPAFHGNTPIEVTTILGFNINTD